MRKTRGQIIAHLLCLLPLLKVIVNYFSNHLTANPIQEITLRTGRTSIYLLLISLACTPVRRLLRLSALLPIRKTLGLYAFLYATLHFLTFVALDFQFNWRWIAEEIRFKPFLKIGLAALLLLIPLAVTSIKKLQKKLGKIWSPIHKLVYLCAALMIVHIFLSAKGDYYFPILLSVIFIALMILRIPPFNKMQIRESPAWLRRVNQYLLQ